MNAIVLKPSPAEADVVTLANGQKIQYNRGAWRLFASTTIGGGVQLPSDLVRTSEMTVAIAQAIRGIDRLDLKFQATTGVMDLSVCQSYTLANTTSGVKTLSFTNVPVGRSMTVVLQVTGNTGSVVFPASIAWPDGTPSLVAGSAMFALYYNGSTWTGVQGPSA